MILGDIRNGLIRRADWSSVAYRFTVNWNTGRSALASSEGHPDWQGYDTRQRVWKSQIIVSRSEEFIAAVNAM